MNTRLAGGLALGFFLAGSSSQARQSSEVVSKDRDLQITIGVHNYAQVGSGVLLKAERATSQALRNAGISVVWLTCSTSEISPTDAGCANLVGPLRIDLHIESKPTAGRLRQKGDVFGIAAEGGEGEFGCDAWVFYDQVKDSATETGLSLPQILGGIIAHELGHLLLGANSHSRTGLMRAHWSREELLAADLGELGFSNPERERIRNSVIARRQRS